jgi:hypothetical protein
MATGRVRKHARLSDSEQGTFELSDSDERRLRVAGSLGREAATVTAVTNIASDAPVSSWGGLDGTAA